LAQVLAVASFKYQVAAQSAPAAQAESSAFLQRASVVLAALAANLPPATTPGSIQVV